MIRLLSLSIALLFSIITFEIIQVSLNQTKAISTVANYLLMGIVILMTIGPIIYMVINLKMKKI